ncbi:sodium:calcium antiporter [Kiritimatiella glycovorans]|uniref:Inner membrane protein YrbG n=1 Tax=Kiritimatiella glycovorans TaxID=1307763 RepID=A0A0G3EJC2_9BACT|nr:sodium:calcium antiporter [Kiritimatiella glycovorans]AKJ64880.1 Inner membrane protein YrbG [Kiritimatiella glycovorans]
MVSWLQFPAVLAAAFVLTAAVVVRAGVRLSLYGDALSERTKIGAGLIGLIFLAAVTSLPELAVSVASVVRAGFNAQGLAGADRVRALSAGADLATGNMLGSNVFNLMILVVLDAIRRSEPVLARVNPRHLRSAFSGLILLGLFAAAFAFDRRNGLAIPLLGTGWLIPLLPLAYVYMVRGYQRREPPRPPEMKAVESRLIGMPAAAFYGRLLALALVIVLGGAVLSALADRMALPPELGGFGLKQSFIGTLFLAIATSLPELVVCAAAVRYGFVDMAVGNVLGSNMFNLLILFVADIALRGEALLYYAAGDHWLTALEVLLLTLLLIAAVRRPGRRTFLRLGIYSWLMLVVYVVFAGMLY